MRKIVWRVTPLMMVCYMFAFVLASIQRAAQGSRGWGYALRGTEPPMPT